MEPKIRLSIITALVIISITFTSSDPVGYGFQPYSSRSARRDDHGPQHYVMPIMRNNNNHFTDNHQHIVKEHYAQKPYQQQASEAVVATKKPVVTTTKKPEVTTTTPTTTTTSTNKLQGRGLSSVATKDAVPRKVQVKAYYAFQTVKTTTTTTVKPRIDTTTSHYVRQSVSAPTTTSSPLKLTTKQIPEVRNATENTLGESENEKTTAEVAPTPQGTSKLNATELKNERDNKLGKKHRHRHHHSRHGHHHKHHEINGGNQENGKQPVTSDNKPRHHHHHHHSQDGTSTGSHHRHFHGIKSFSKGSSHKRHQRHYEGGYASDANHGRRVKREEAVHAIKQKRSEAVAANSAKSGSASTSVEGNEIADEESGSYSESDEDGRASSWDANANVLDVAPGPYLQHHSEEDNSEEIARMDGAAREPILDNWSEFVAHQRSTLLADPESKRVYKTRSYIPVMDPEDHFKLIDKQYKDNNDKVVAFHNLHDFLKQQRMKFRIPETPLPSSVGSRIFVDIMSDTE